MLTNDDRARYGHLAMNAGTPDRGQNGNDHDGIRTDGKDTIANVLHSLRVAGAVDEDNFRQVLSAAGDYFWEEAFGAERIDRAEGEGRR